MRIKLFFIFIQVSYISMFYLFHKNFIIYFYYLFIHFFVLLRVKKCKADSIKMFSIPIEAVVKREDKKNDNCN